MIYAQSLVILVRQQIVNAEYCKILNVHSSFIGFIVGKVMVTNPLDQASVPRYELVYKDIWWAVVLSVKVQEHNNG